MLTSQEYIERATNSFLVHDPLNLVESECFYFNSRTYYRQTSGLSRMSGDLTHFLAPSSRLPSDITFYVKDQTFPAHKAILATALPAFDDLFFGPEANPSLTSITLGEIISPAAFHLFLWHNYGQQVEVAGLQLATLAELYSLARQYLEESLMKKTNIAMEKLISMEMKPTNLIEYRELIEKHKVEQLLELMETKMKTVSLDEESFDTFLGLAAAGDSALTPALGEFLGRHCPSSQQLATFLRTRPGLHPATVLQVISAIPGGLATHNVEVGSAI